MYMDFSVPHPTFSVHASPSKYLLPTKSSKLMQNDSSSLNRSTEEFCSHPTLHMFKNELTTFPHHP